jgi:peptide subunit release factor 1 (eRF1)
VSEDDTGKGARGSLKGKSGTGREAWAGWRETKIQHHIEDHLQRYLKNLSVKLFRFIRNNEVDYVVLAGPKGEKGEIINAFKPHLHTDLRKKIIGTFPGDSRVEESELRERFHKVVGEFKQSRERKFLERLLEESDRPSGLGVLGLEKTLGALRKGQVKVLAIDQDSELAGWICPDDYYLSLEEESCPVCGSNLKLTEDLLGQMVWEAIDQRSEVRFVKTDKNERFNEAQVGGLLRFR